MISPGQRFYERYRRHETDAIPWGYLDQEERIFWDAIAKTVEGYDAYA